MFKSSELTGKQQQELLRKDYKISTSRQSSLRKIAAGSSDKSLRFWGSKIGKKTMTPSQFKETLKKIKQEEGTSNIKSVDSRVNSFMKSEKKAEIDKQLAVEKKVAHQRSVKYRKYLRIKDDSEEKKDVRTRIREEMERREDARLGTNEQGNSKTKTDQQPVISASQLDTHKEESGETNNKPQSPETPLDLPLD